MPPTRDDLIAAITEIRESEVPSIVDSLLANGTPTSAIIDSCREAMGEIGRRFGRGEAFIPELIMAGELMKAVSEHVKPHLTEGEETKKRGCVVLGTVKGDIHDIGKDLVGSLLAAAGFEVVDLGVDVPAERFVETVQGRHGAILALSCMLTTGFEAMHITIGAISDAGLRDQVKVMVGGAPVTERVCAYAAADGWGSDAATALELAMGWAN
jgi:methanogenic corrinoid protein MtbC1